MPQIDESDRLLAHGQAALVLVEGVLLVLIEAGIVDKGQILEAIETAISTKRALSDDEQESRNVSTAAIALLIRIENSLLAAQPDGSDPARVTRITVADPSTVSDQVTEQARRVDKLPGERWTMSNVTRSDRTRRGGQLGEARRSAKLAARTGLPLAMPTVIPSAWLDGRPAG